MTHPYRNQAPRAFWNRTVSPYHALDVGEWYLRRFDLSGSRIATAGSCFAQHIGRNLRLKGFQYLDMEPAPALVKSEDARDFGYGMYSARYGNVYTSRQLVQLLRRSLGQFSPIEDYWEKDGGVVDPFRPTIEPVPFGSVYELRTLREDHLQRVVEVFRQAEVFVFTLGLTEAWLSRRDGSAFPLCPGTAGGNYDPALHEYKNLGFRDVRSDMDDFIALARSINPSLRLLLTVSPVPLAATASAQQVAVATTYSKSVLRAVAGDLYESDDDIDYFPSYEIITAPFMRGCFYQPDAREVSPHGVAHVMSIFFSQHAPPVADAKAAESTGSEPSAQDFSEIEDAERIKCDEELLAAFGESSGQ
jgi:hypothetical protein